MTAQRIVVLASGSGTLLQSMLDADDLGATIVAIGSDRVDAAALGRAGDVPTFAVPLSAHPDRAAWDEALTAAVARHEPDWVVTAGFMRLLGPAFLARSAARSSTRHPALLPSFPGAHGVRDALAYGVKVTGCTVHLVDAGVDTGPIIAQEAVPVVAGDDEASAARAHQGRRARLLVAVVRAPGRPDGYSLDDRPVTIP